MTRREEALHLVVEAARVIGMSGSDRRDRARLRDALETLDAIDAASAPAPVESAPGARLCPECADTGTRTFGGGPCSKGCRAPASPPAAEPGTCPRCGGKIGHQGVCILCGAGGTVRRDTP